MTSSPVASVGSLRDRLARLRARMRRITMVTGASRILVAAAALLACSFVADRFLDLPLVVRRFVRAGLVDRPPDFHVLAWMAALAASAVGLVATARRGLGAASVFAFLIAGVPGVLLFLGWRALVRPLWGPPSGTTSDERLAADVERRHKALNDRLLASLDFESQLAHPTRGESATFMAKTIEEADQEARSIEFSSVATARGAWSRLGLATLSIGVFASVCAAVPEFTSLWWRRSALLEDVSWPRVTTLVVVVRDAAGVARPRDPATPYVVSLGQPLTVTVRAEGKVPTDVEIFDRTERDGPLGRALSHRMRAVSTQAGLFEYEFRDVRGGFSFYVRGGDDRDDVPVHTVVVRVPPHVVGLRADLEFPAYLLLPPRHVDNGSFAVPEGTRVAISFESDAPGASAEAFLDDAPVAVEAVDSSDLRASDGRAPTGEGRANRPPGGPTTYTFRTTAVKSFRYRVRIVAADGRENDPSIDVYEVAVEPDTPAKPEWVWPRGPIETTPEGRVPLFAQTRDDHAVSQLTLDIDVPGAATRSIPLTHRTSGDVTSGDVTSGDVTSGGGPPGQTWAANDRAYGVDSIRSYVALEIASLSGADGKPLTAPQRITVRVSARDSKGQESSGAWTSIDLLKPDELERSFSSRRTSLKTEIEGLRDELKQIRSLTGVPVDAAADVERRALRDVQYRQGKLRSDVDRTARGVTSLFQSNVYGRIGGKAATERILAILDRRHRLLWVHANRDPAPNTPSAAAFLDVDDEVFPYDLFREVAQARRDRRLLDSDVLDRLVAVLDGAITVAADSGPAAYDAAVVAARTGTEADVNTLLAAQTRLAEGIETVLSAMKQWQSLAELTLFVRRLIDEQEVLRGDIRNLGNGTNK